MSWKVADVESVLSSHGFEKTNSSNFGNEYSRKLSGALRATAYVSTEGGFWEAKTDKVKKVDFTLESKGTTYRCLSLGALTTKIAHIVAELDSVSKTPEKLKCPQCGTRDVHMKEPLSSSGKQFKPFLSCDGMTVVGKGQKKHIACNGTSDALPALVAYS